MRKNNLRKSPEDARKYVGSDVREGKFSREARVVQVNLIKVGRVWWFLRNSRQHATAASHWNETSTSLIWSEPKIAQKIFETKETPTNKEQQKINSNNAVYFISRNW